MDKSKLHIFTAKFPTTKFEVYLDSEVEKLANEYDELHIIPFLPEGESTRILSTNSTVHLPKLKKSRKFFLKYFKIVCALLLSEIKNRGLFHVIKNSKTYLRYISQSLSYLNYLKTNFAIGEIRNAYSNWFVDWSLVLCLYKKYYYPDLKLLVKCHRYDLYESEYYLKFIPFRKFELDIVNEVVSISNDGLGYLESKYPEYSSKMHLFRLGSPDHGISPLSSDVEEIILVTCSNVKKVKRLHLMIEVLKLCNRRITWHHFGDGELLNELKQNAINLPKSITVIFHGRIASHELYEFYKSHYISLFINLSSSEGIPVSIMEAISFGIPVLATNVGGTSEIINEKTGRLIPNNFSIQEISTFIDTFDATGFREISFRKGVREFWNDNFESTINTNLFVNFTKQLFK